MNDDVLDAALQVLTDDGQTLHMCTQEPDTYSNATGAYSLGSEGSIQIGSPGVRTGGGRKVLVLGLNNISISTTGTATHWAIVDDTNSKLLCSRELSMSYAVTSGTTRTLGSFDIEILEP